MGTVKVDYPPLLAPGRHYLSIVEVENLCVQPFIGAALARRTNLFQGLEGFLQALLVARIKCDLFCDGSFFTEKPEPDDVDVIVSVELSIHESLSGAQLDVLDAINNDAAFAPGVDCCALVTYPRDHKNYGAALDLGNAGEAYGVEHGQVWLKGYAVIRVWESDVTNRICR